MLKEQDALYGYVISMLDQGLKRDHIITHLMDNGHEETFVKQLVAETVKLRDARRRSNGLALILCGAFICLMSFILTITSSFTHGSFPLVLYGLTSIGIIVAFAGFMKVF